MKQNLNTSSISTKHETFKKEGFKVQKILKKILENCLEGR